MANSIEELVQMIAKRDGISYNEASTCVEDCQVTIDYIVAKGGSVDEAEWVIRDYLGLEPDYLELFL